MLKYFLFFVLLIATAFAGFYFGSNRVRDGLVANYPTIKTLVNRSYVEIDTSLTFPITAEETPELFALSSASKTDSPTLTVNVIAKYGTNLDSHFYKINKNGNEIEAMLPKTWVIAYKVVSYTSTIKGVSENELLSSANKDLATLLPIRLERMKAFQAEAKSKIATALMFYFMPYQFDLKVYFDNQELKLPIVVGLNKKVEEYIGEQVGKK
jgi:hypothetical protein